MKSFPPDLADWYSHLDARDLLRRAPDNLSSEHEKARFWAGQLNRALKKGWELRDQASEEEGD